MKIEAHIVRSFPGSGSKWIVKHKQAHRWKFLTLCVSLYEAYSALTLSKERAPRVCLYFFNTLISFMIMKEDFQRRGNDSKLIDLKKY